MTEITMTLTRDRNGVVLWQREPRFCHGDATYMNGGQAMTLPDELFSDMRVPSRRTMRLAPVEGER